MALSNETVNSDISIPQTPVLENKDKIEKQVALKYNSDQTDPWEIWKFEGSGTSDEYAKDFRDFIDESFKNGKEIPDEIKYFSNRDALKDIVGNSTSYINRMIDEYNAALRRYGVSSYNELNEKIKENAIKENPIASTEKETNTSIPIKEVKPNPVKKLKSVADITDEEDARIARMSGKDYLKELLENGLSEEEAKEAMEAFNAKYPASDWKGVSFDINKAFSQIAKETKKEEKKEEPAPIKEMETIFEANGINIYSEDVNSPDLEAKLQSMYANATKAERKTIDKAMSKMAPTIQKAWDAVKEKNDSNIKKFFKNWVSRMFTNDSKKEEWLRQNPTPLSAIFGDSGLNAGQRIGLFLGLTAAITSDFLKGYSDGMNNRPSSGAKATENFVKPFTDINLKNIERITGLKDASNASEKSMEEKISAYKQDNRLNILSRSTLASLISFFENPDNKFTEETMAEYENEFKKAYEQNFGNISTETLSDYNAWKARTLKHFFSKQGINPERLENQGKFLDLAIKENELAQQVHNFEFSSIDDYNNAIAQLREELISLETLRNETSASDTSKLYDLATKYRGIISGLSNTNTSNGENTGASSTTGSSNSGGGSASVGGDIKLVHIGVEGSFEHSDSKTNAKTTNKAKNKAVFKDEANDRIYNWLKENSNGNGTSKELTNGKETLLKAIDSQIDAVKATIKEMELMKNKIISNKRVSFDDQLNNLYETGFYEKPRIKNDNYYKYRLGLV